MKKKLFMLPVMAMFLFFLSAIAFEKNAEAAGRKLIASGACGVVHYADEGKYTGENFKIDESVQYRLYKDGTMVISGSGKMGDFDSWCEGSHTWFRRKELIPWYDYRKDIRKVIVKKGVTNIGSAAFYGCKNLESIEWADSIKGIEGCAFYGCKNLESVQWPDSIKWIGGYAFYGCTKLESVPWTERIEWVGGSAFQKCSSLKEVKLPSYVKRWGEDVFAECTGLKKVSIDADFQFSVRYIEKGGPEYIEGTEEFFPIVSDCDGNGMFRGCTALKEVKLPKDSLVIPDYFVEGCCSLKTFPIPDNVIYWGSCPPSLCKGKYILPDSVRKLGYGAFAGCSDLEELVLPEGLVYMYGAFEGCSSLKTLKIPESVRELYKTFYNCTGLEYIVVPDTVQKIGYPYNPGVFEGCSNLKSVVLPENLKSIGDNFFRNCKSLRSINLPPNIVEIHECAFEGCSSLTDIRLPDTVEHIERYAFYGCTSLEEIDIPKGVNVLYDKVFYNCKKLKRVTVHAEEFGFYGEKIFYGCKKLSGITTYAKNAKKFFLPYSAFDGVQNEVTVYVPKESINAYKKWLKGTPGLKDIKPMQ